MEFETDGVRFTIPDKITVRQQLEYGGKMAFSSDQRIVKMFQAAVDLIEEWESDIIEDIKTFDIDKSTSRKHAEICSWVGTQVYIYMQQIEDVPKN